MNMLAKFGCAGVMALSFAGAVQAEGALNLYNWGDYINPGILKKFTEETGIEVNLDTYSSNEEMLAKLQAGATGYDIVFPSVHMQDIMSKLDLLLQTDINQSAGFANIDPLSLRAKSDPEGVFCLPYAFGTVGIYYKPEITGEITGWDDFFAIPEKTGGRITLLDDMREVLAIGHVMNGTSVNSVDPAEITAAQDYILKQRPNVSAFTYDVPGLIATDDIAAAQYFIGMHVLTSNMENVKYVIPKEGGTLYQENMCVLKSAPNAENAKAFMEFYLRPEIAAMNVEQQFNGTPNIPARDLASDYIRNNPNITLPDETYERLQTFEDLGRGLRLYDRAWNTIRTAQ
ncbi:spermidine/putrescine ABC transporter substrate-binding protein [Tritonibacter sp. AK171]|uniref:polyamine ABC transporter substrate-binding protein n=1 Tax=Tritonibacter sp. AK171 TaxID=3048493 RepID=UPI0024C3CE17|nr:spermidine/putrescine ABC transporter substrate-binding protein [Tritonibacter sp. AK171]